MMRIFQAVWSYRYFILSSIETEFRSRFARSKLGGLWMLLHPLAQVLIYALVLSQIMSAKLPGIESQYAYPIYLLAGMLGWTLFSEILTRLLTVFIDNGNLLKKMAFPKLALPLIAIGSALINFTLLFLIMFIVFAFLGHMPLHAIYWLPILILITIGLSIGIGLILGTINVFIRDIGQAMTIILQFWFWLTPIVYMPSIIPEKYQGLLMMNPMTGIIMGYQSVLVYDKTPDAGLLIYPAIVAAATMVLAMIIFRRASEEMADVL
jgi:lipopolysaccharide transport system permease protein